MFYGNRCFNYFNYEQKKLKTSYVPAIDPNKFRGMHL